MPVGRVGGCEDGRESGRVGGVRESEDGREAEKEGRKTEGGIEGGGKVGRWMGLKSKNAHMELKLSVRDS